jgi:ParB family chromosome partitioning protein
MSKGKRKVLGRGLEALIPREVQAPKKEPGLLHCEVDRLVPNKDQPRQSFDEQKLRELSESVRSRGIIHPLIVRKQNGGFTIVTGERRWRAAKLAGLKTVPVLVKDISDAEMVEMALVENIQREDLNPLEEAEAYRQLIEEHGLTQDQLAKRVGRQRSSVANVLRLLKLPAEIRRYVLTGELSMGHARAILGVVGSSAQTALARRVVKERLSVRECEELVRQAPAPAARRKKRPRKASYSTEEYRLIESMQRRLGTKVDLRKSTKGGRVIIHYYSPEELDRIVNRIEGY